MKNQRDRVGRHLTFEPSDGVRVELQLGDIRLSCTLTQISKEELQLTPPPEPPADWYEGLELLDLTVRLDEGDFGAHIGRIGRARVNKVEVVDAGLSLQLLPEGDVARSQTWCILDELATGEIRLLQGNTIIPSEFPRVPARGIYTEEARLERLDFARNISGAALEHAGHTRLQAEKLTGNIENLIGAVEVPVGIAGPLLFRGQRARGPLYAPLATSEGALVASATRGARALTAAGGVTTRVIQQRMMRVPLFVLSDMEGALLFTNWVRDHKHEISEQTKKVSRHANLVEVKPAMLGNMVHVSFLYETGDAAGQNMTTTCTWHACLWLMEQLRHIDAIQFDNFIIEANMSGDKKVNFGSFIAGRGSRVSAEAFLDRATLEQVLKVSPEQLIRSNQSFMAGSMQVGMVGYNINIANVIAAMFTATGQDIACVHESSIGQLHLAPADDGVYASILLPSLIVGTVGGGTGLPQQQDYLELLGCAGPGKVARLAEIIAGFCLALDLSTLSAIASGQFARAHEKLGRNRPVQWFKADELNAEFFQGTLDQQDPGSGRGVVGAEADPHVPIGSSIITQLTARKVQKLVGLFPYRLDVERDGKAGTLDVLVKSKPLDGEVIIMINGMASGCGARVADAHNRHRETLGFAGCHIRELAIYRESDSRFTDIAPKVYGIHEDEDREAYILVLEQLRNMLLMDSADDVSGWGRAEIEAALVGIGRFHAIWYGREEELLAQPWIVAPPTLAGMIEKAELWEALGVHAMNEFPQWFGPSDLSLHRELVRNIPRWWKPIESMPRTLIHNDFNPRNVALRPTAEGPQLCAYDWELATLHLPQRDVAEFLSFVLSPDATEAEVDHYVGVHRRALEEAAGVTISEEDSRFAYRRGLQDFAITRLAMYMMAHTFRHYGFMERLAKTTRSLIRIEMGL
jgi:NADP-dependent 3-hydroxy-3-methylglutaryl-CoA reductase